MSTNQELVFSELKEISMEEVRKHTSADNCWIVIRGLVYDVSKFLRNHPGGIETIVSIAGQDVTLEFEAIHFFATRVLEKKTDLVIGRQKGYVPKKPAEIQQQPENDTNNNNNSVPYCDQEDQIQHHQSSISISSSSNDNVMGTSISMNAAFF